MSDRLHKKFVEQFNGDRLQELANCASRILAIIQFTEEGINSQESTLIEAKKFMAIMVKELLDMREHIQSIEGTMELKKPVKK